MAVLPDAWLIVLNILIGAPVAWRSPAEIATVLDRGEEETTDLLSELDEAGWLVIWETESGPLVTLSALAAERLGVRLVEIGFGGTPRWAREGEPDPPPSRSKNVCHNSRAASLEFVLDPAASPALAAELGERVVALAATFRQTPPRPGAREDPTRPTQLVGLGLTPWPGPPVVSGAICPACGDRMLAPQMYCLYCDRWGLDLLTQTADTPPVTVTLAAAAGRVRREVDRATTDQLQTEQLRARRRSKRQRRHHAKLDADRARKPSTLPTIAPNTESRPAFVLLHSPPTGKTSASAPR